MPRIEKYRFGHLVVDGDPLLYPLSYGAPAEGSARF
jgi:hypothetical protein